MSDGRPFWAGERGWPGSSRRQRVSTLDALLTGLDSAPADLLVPATGLVWLGVDSEAASRDGDDFDDGHRAWLDRAEYWPEFRAALGALERLDGELARASLAGAFAARPQSDTPVPAPLFRDHDPLQQELAELVRRERLAALAEGARGTTRYLSLYDAVAVGVARMAVAGVELSGESVIARATFLAAHPDESVAIALDSRCLLDWRLRWAADPESERALLLAEALARGATDIHQLLAALASSSFAWVAVPSRH